ncbi:cytosolic protein [bacterium]|nr:cytosolic protein [bacterium]
MSGKTKTIDPADDDLLAKMIVDGFHRIIVHYGQWFAQVEHQFGMKEAGEIEQKVWDVSLQNQLQRIGKRLGFSIEEGIPTVFKEMTRETKLELLKDIGINWLANDGIWFQAVENRIGLFDAKRTNDTCWTRYSPFEASRIKELLGLPELAGISGLKDALSFRMYSLINEQSIEEVDENSIILRMNNCRVQAARKRKGLEDYHCKSAGIVEYRTFAETIDKRIKTECIGCPPDEHPVEWFCAWKFTLTE